MSAVDRALDAQAEIVRSFGAITRDTLAVGDDGFISQRVEYEERNAESAAYYLPRGFSPEEMTRARIAAIIKSVGGGNLDRKSITLAAQTFRDGAASAFPFAVDRGIMPLIEAGCAGLPGTAELHAEILPAREGLVVPDDPILDGQVVAFMWMPAIEQPNGGYTTVPHQMLKDYPPESQGDAASIIFFAPGMRPLSHLCWKFGRTVDRMTLEPPSGPDADLLMGMRRWFLALMLFLDQRVVVAEHEHGSRHAVRRASGLVEDPNRVRVVRLRRTEQRHDAKRADDFEYSCRFLVRGFWRNQYHPSDKSHRPKWIAPFWKGPEDAPLRIPKTVVFKVDR